MARLSSSAALAGLARNPSLAPELVDRFVAVADAELCLDLAERADLTADQVRTLVARVGSGAAVRLARQGRLTVADIDPSDPAAVLAAVDLPGAPRHWFADLATNPDPLVRAALAEATRLPAEARAVLATDRATDVVAALARSPWLTASLAESLAGHPHMTVRRAVAGNELTPPSVLAGLAGGGQPPASTCFGCDDGCLGRCFDRDGGWLDRDGGCLGCGDRAESPPDRWCDGGHADALADLDQTVAANPRTPPAALAGFVEHRADWVRYALAGRADLPPAAYQRLAVDAVPGVRAAVAGNPAIGEPLIRSMMDDRAPDVRRRLAHNPAIPLDLLAGVAARSRIGPTLVPRIAAATGAEIEDLARSPIAAMRMLVAQRPDLPAATVDRLAADADAKVLKSVAPNPQVDPSRLRKMVADHGVRVAVAVATNPLCTPDLLDELVQQRPAVQRVFRVVAAHPNATGTALLLCLRDRQARPVAAGHPALPIAVLMSLLSDPDASVAEAAGANPALPPVVMELLLHTDD